MVKNICILARHCRQEWNGKVACDQSHFLELVIRSESLHSTAREQHVIFSSIFDLELGIVYRNLELRI